MTSRYETLVGLSVSDDDMYQTYRDEMRPILEAYDGGFGYDFIVSEVLKSETPEPINRVFTIYFPDQEKAESFFLDETYLAIKQRTFEKAVSSTTILATYVKEVSPGT